MKHEKKLEALVARTKALDAKITKAKAVSVSHQRAIDKLIADVERYNTTTKRFDISVVRAVFITPVPNDAAQDRAQTLQGFGGQPFYYSHDSHQARMSTGATTGCNCPACPPNPPNAPFGDFCWLETESSGCNKDCSIRVCSYRCVRTFLSLPT